MNTAETGNLDNAMNKIVDFANTGNTVSLAACIDFASKNPGSEIAKQIEVAGVKISAHKHFTQLKADVSSLGEQKPVFGEVPVAADLKRGVQEFSERVRVFTSDFFAKTQEIIGEKPGNEAEAELKRLKVLRELSSNVTEITVGQNAQVLKVMAGLGAIGVDAEIYREGISVASQGAVEYLYNAIQAGSDVFTDLVDGESIPKTIRIYDQEVSDAFVSASGVADRAVRGLNNDES